MTEENNKTAAAKIGVYRHWMVTLRDVQWEIEEFEYDLEYQRYEMDVTQRVHDAAEDEKARKHWQKQLARIHKAMVATETDLAKAQRQVAYCEAMLEIIRGDLEAEGIDPNACELDEFYFDDEFDEELDDEFDDDDIPF
ncbi:MAG TPA: hypothetical protein PKZ84_05305 [Anaerolineae bacterium]|nr:hypothetical protein [Anaerolineae bacterium]HQI83731.1 hypothetical protein [Anaerolineae bacterium]